MRSPAFGDLAMNLQGLCLGMGRAEIQLGHSC